ncbi:MAG: hypothetical protein ABII90_15275 [Bacteroidota bacterium]
MNYFQSKKTLFAILSLMILNASSNFSVSQTPEGVTTYPEKCKSSVLLKETKPLLDDYVYDSMKLTKIKYKDVARKKGLDVFLFIDVKHKFIFNTSALPLGMGITIYDKRPTSKNRKLLFNSGDFPGGDKLIVFDPEEGLSGIYIEYNIPAATDNIQYGCVFTVTGYKLEE